MIGRGLWMSTSPGYPWNRPKPSFFLGSAISDAEPRDPPNVLCCNCGLPPECSCCLVYFPLRCSRVERTRRTVCGKNPRLEVPFLRGEWQIGTRELFSSLLSRLPTSSVSVSQASGEPCSGESHFLADPKPGETVSCGSSPSQPAGPLLSLPQLAAQGAAETNRQDASRALVCRDKASLCIVEDSDSVACCIPVSTAARSEWSSHTCSYIRMAK